MSLIDDNDNLGLHLVVILSAAAMCAMMMSGAELFIRDLMVTFVAFLVVFFIIFLFDTHSFTEAAINTAITVGLALIVSYLTYFNNYCHAHSWQDRLSCRS